MKPSRAIHPEQPCTPRLRTGRAVNIPVIPLWPQGREACPHLLVSALSFARETFASQLDDLSVSIGQGPRRFSWREAASATVSEAIIRFDRTPQPSRLRTDAHASPGPRSALWPDRGPMCAPPRATPRWPDRPAGVGRARGSQRCTARYTGWPGVRETVRISDPSPQVGPPPWRTSHQR